jgi:hypothetical protein
VAYCPLPAGLVAHVVGFLTHRSPLYFCQNAGDALKAGRVSQARRQHRSLALKQLVMQVDPNGGEIVLALCAALVHIVKRAQ